MATRLSENAGRHVLLVESGPDYPGLRDLPQEIADSRTVAESHDWGYTSEPDEHSRSISLPRGKIVGGCSSVNATLAPRGFPSDYDEWATLGNPGWGFDQIMPFFCRAETDLDFGDAPWHGSSGPMPIKRYAPAARSTLSDAFLASAESVGCARVDDHNRPGALGAGPAPVNVRDSIRMSCALAYLASARARPNLTVLPDALVDCVELREGVATGIRLADGRLIEAGTVVLSAGAYGSPAILLRSGIGPPDDLRRLGIEPRLSLPGVGRNLIDHPRGSLDLPLRIGSGDGPRFQVLLTARATSADAGDDCDLHVAAAGPFGDPGSGWSVAAVLFSVMKPRSVGRIELRSPRPSDPPRIWPAHLTDPRDLPRMLEGLLLARQLARSGPFAPLVDGQELAPAPGIADDDTDGLEAALLATTQSYHHPVGTCAMGSDPDAGAVTDAHGRVHGVAGLRVVDASVMPTIPAANTNLPTIAVAERLSDDYVSE
jgi:choline dehydrogenase